MTRRQAVLLAATLATTTWAGMMHGIHYDILTRRPVPFWSLPSLWHGLAYSLPLLWVLAWHEAFHKIACWRHGISTSGPYFLPIGLPLVGTFGAVLRVKSAWPSRTALLEVGALGPIGGFLALLPVLILGCALSGVTSAQMPPNTVRFGTPVVLEWLISAMHGPGYIVLHPVGAAAWIGCLFTMLNLVPFFSFDGGHVVRGAFGVTAWRATSVASFLVTAWLARKSMTWAVLAAAMVLSMVWPSNWTPQDVSDEHRAPADRWPFVLICAVIFVACWNQIDIR